MEKLLQKLRFHPSSQEDIECFKEKRRKGITISGPLLKQKAEYFSKKLGKIDYALELETILYLEDVPVKIQVSTWKSLITGLKTVWPTLRIQYKVDQIFNADETDLFFKAPPQNRLKFKNQKCSGGKMTKPMTKQRITVLVAANMSGTLKRKLLVIGKSKNPRCF